MAEQNASSTSSDLTPTLDRRDYFRVEDQLILRYCSVTPDAIGNMPAERHFDNSEMFALLRELRQIDQEHNNVLRGLTEQNRELGAYLKSINRKVDLIANALATLSHDHQQQVAQRVSISEGGIAFASDTSLAPGKFLALELVLLPAHTGLALYGEVLETRNESGLTVVSFIRMRESDRQILARHILQVQIAAKRQQSKDFPTE
ncbi:MAG: PilZ domain-containing protein [Spongiibacteraceae bacterium]